MSTNPVSAEILRNTGIQLWDVLTASLSRRMRPLARLPGALRARREIAVLLRFSDRELKDIGLSHSDVEAALSLPLYQDPSRKLAALIATKGVEG